MNSLEQFLTDKADVRNSKGRITISLKAYFKMTNSVGVQHKKQEEFMDNIMSYFMSEQVEIFQLQGDDPELFGIVKSFINHVELSKIGLSNSECKVLVIKDAGFIDYKTGDAIKLLLNNIYETDCYVILSGSRKSNWGGVKKHIALI